MPPITTEQPSKPLWKSKTLIGVFVAVLPTLLSFFGVKIADVGEFSVAVTEGIDQAVLLVGAVLAAYGRIKATAALK
jgi:hypothetical protein